MCNIIHISHGFSLGDIHKERPKKSTFISGVGDLVIAFLCIHDLEQSHLSEIFPKIFLGRLLAIKE